MKRSNLMLVVCIVLSIACVGTAFIGLRKHFIAKAEEEYALQEEPIDEPVYEEDEEDELPPPDSAETRYLVRKAMVTGDKADLEAAAAALTGVPNDNASTGDVEEPYVAPAPEEPVAQDAPMDDSYDVGDDIVILNDRTMLRVSPSLDSSTVGYWMAGDRTKIYDMEFVDGILWVNTHPNKNWWITMDEFERI